MELLSEDNPKMLTFVDMLMMAIRVEMNPLSSQNDRQEAHRLCEKLRTEESPAQLATAGIILVSKPDVQIIFAGFKILEGVIRFHWNDLENREIIKARLVEVLRNGFSNVNPCPLFLHEALARTLAEIAKREWPQLWPDFVPILFDIGQVTNAAYLVLRRFFEDIVQFQSADSGERKRDLTQGLTVISSDTVSRLFCLLFASIEELNVTNSPVAAKKCKVLLGSLVPFFETANLDLFLQASRINLLFSLLNHSELKNDAADCILQLVQRKPRKEDKYEIVNACLQYEHFNYLIEAAKKVDEDETYLLKQLCDIFTCIATGCAFGKVKLELFFSAAEVLASRKEACAVLGGVTAMNIFFKNLEKSEYENFRQSPFREASVRFTNLVIRKFVTTTSTVDEKEELYRLKSEFYVMLRSLSSIVPKLYLLLNHWISSAHASNIENYQWEVLAGIFDTLTSLATNEDNEVISAGLKDLELCFETYSRERDLKRKSVLLSSVSSLFAFLSLARKNNVFEEHANNMMCSILKSLFQCFRYPETEREIRRHVSALFVKLGLKNAGLLVSIFDSMYKEACDIKEIIHASEYKNIIEALLMISNEFGDKSKQLSFIGTLVTMTEWQEMSVIIGLPNMFPSFSADAPLQPKKPLFLRNLHILNGILKRVKFPTDTLIFKEAVFNHIRPTLPVVLELIKSIHNLIFDPNLAFLLEMSIAEKYQLLGIDLQINQDLINASEAPKTPQEQLKNFVRQLQELTYGILGNCCAIFRTELYNIPSITDAFLSYVGCGSQFLTDFQIRAFLRSVYKQFLLSCPAEHMETVLKLFLRQFGPFMMTRLTSRWETTLTQTQSNVEQESPSDEAEIVENTSLRLLTKDYFDILVKLLERSKTSDDASNFLSFQGEDTDMDVEMVQNNGRSKAGHIGTTTEAGEVGLMLISDQICFESIIYLSINALAWNDSAVNLRAGRCITLSWSKICVQPDVVVGTFRMALTGIIRLHDQDANFDMLLKLVDTILLGHQSNPSIVPLFMEWGAPELEIGKVLSLSKSFEAKKRKDALKKIVRSHPLITNQNPKSQWLTQLPKLVIENPAKVQQIGTPIDLRECFSLIHNAP